MRGDSISDFAERAKSRRTRVGAIGLLAKLNASCMTISAGELPLMRHWWVMLGYQTQFALRLRKMILQGKAALPAHCKRAHHPKLDQD